MDGRIGATGVRDGSGREDVGVGDGLRKRKLGFREGPKVQGMT